MKAQNWGAGSVFGVIAGLIFAVIGAVFLVLLDDPEFADPASPVSREVQPVGEGELSAAQLAKLTARAKAGEAEAQFELGVVYASGDPTPQEEAEAFKWFHAAARQGHAEAQNLTGSCYTTGRGVAQDSVQAVYWYRLAAAQDHPPALYRLGLCQIGEVGLPKDDKAGLDNIIRAAELGNLGAQLYMAKAVEKLKPGPVKWQQTFKWYRLAAEQGDPEAQFKVAVEYIGGLGVDRDMQQSFLWGRRGANQGHSGCQFLTGGHYKRGEQVKKDLVEAYKWYALSARQGHSMAEDSLQELSRQMTPRQRAEGERRADAFQPQLESDQGEP